jgi:hypothetical protein
MNEFLALLSAKFISTSMALDKSSELEGSTTSGILGVDEVKKA